MKIDFALESIERMPAAYKRDDDEVIIVTGYIRSDDLKEFENIRNVAYPESAIWDDDDDDAGFRVTDTIENFYPPILHVVCRIPDYSNATQGFYAATGVQLDARFISGWHASQSSPEVASCEDR